MSKHEESRDLHDQRETLEPDKMANMNFMEQVKSASGYGTVEFYQNWVGDAAGELKLDMLDPNGEPSHKPETASLVRLPLIGKIHFIKERQGLLCISIVIAYWIYGMWSTYTFILLPRFDEGHIPLSFLPVYAVIGVLCMCSLYKATTMDPGRVLSSMQYSLSPDDTSWTWCAVCKHKRPPRAHHCRRCKHCTLRMDHHCPWINNCVGEQNHFAFMQLIFYAFLMGIVALVLNLLHLFYFPTCTACDADTFASYHKRAFTITSVIMAGMMASAATGLVCIQHVGFITDMTTIDWMKLQDRVHINMSEGKPMTEGVRRPEVRHSCPEAYTLMCRTNWKILWFLPFGRRRAVTPMSSYPYDYEVV